MATTFETMTEAEAPVVSVSFEETAPPASAASSGPGSSKPASNKLGGNKVLLPWVDMQAVNLARHAAALRPFRKDEFGTTSAAPTAGHIEAVNALLVTLRRTLLKRSRALSATARRTVEHPSTAGLQALVNRKERAHRWVQGIEKIWDFYFELFGQRQSRYSNWLLSCDRIALDCYRAAKKKSKMKSF